MKNISIENWDNNICNKGLLFFVQSMEELLFYHSHDSLKIPTLNFHFFWYELLGVINNIERDILDKGNIIPLINEMEFFFKSDVIAMELYGDKLHEIFSEKNTDGNYVSFYDSIMKNKVAESTFSKLKNMAEYILEDINCNNKYYKSIIKKIKYLINQELTFDETDKLYKLTKCILTELINSGYSQEYIFSVVNKTFFDREKRIENIDLIFNEFISKFDFQNNDYNIFFFLNRQLKKDLLGIEEVKIISNNKSNKDKYPYIGCIKFSAIDPESARIEAKKLIERYVSFLNYDRHKRRANSLEIFEIVDEKTKEVFSTAKIVEPFLRGTNRKETDMSLSGIKLNRNALNNIFNAIELHSSALETDEVKNQLLNLWTGIEVLIPIDRKGGLSKINQICNVLTTVLSAVYFRSLIDNFRKDIKSIDSVFFKEIEGIDGNDDIEKLLFIMVLSEYKTQKEKLREILSKVPLLEYRLDYYCKIFGGVKEIKDIYINHSKRIRNQIMRIYRNRNMIIHDGTASPYIELIIQNLHYYFDSLVDEIIYYSKLGFNGLNTIYKHISYNENLMLLKLEKKDISKDLLLELLKKDSI